METLTLGHDPFARHEIRKVSAGRCACAWCGQSPEPRGGRFMFTLEMERDDRPYRPEELLGGRAFCSVSCARSYHA